MLALGGTLDSLGADRLDLAHYTETRRRLPDGRVLEDLPEVDRYVDVDQVPFPRTPSHAIDEGTWLRLGREVQAQCDRSDVSGVVVTHGTNTLEETAYLLHLTLSTSRPVVVVGAMRPWNALGTDGPLALVQALRFAAAPEATPGVWVLMGGSVWSPRAVSKRHTYAPDAFGAPSSGPSGHLDADGTIRMLQLPVLGSEGRYAAALAGEALPRVGIVVSHVGADGLLIDALAASRVDGIVSAGTGPGVPTPLEDEAFGRAIAAGVVVCQASRVGSGPVPARASQFERGILTAGDLSPWKARIALALALTVTRDPRELQAMMFAA